MDFSNFDQTINESLNSFSLNNDFFNEEESLFKNEYENTIFEPASNETINTNISTTRKRKPPIYCLHYRWTDEEDNELGKLVKEFGENDWRHLAKKMEGRNSRQCRERWQYYLNPNLKVGNWTKEEDDLILSKTEEIGPKWMTIKNFFPNRTDAMIKNRYRALTKEKNKKEETFFDYLNKSKLSESDRNSDNLSNINQTSIIKISKNDEIKEKMEDTDYLNYLTHNICDEDDDNVNFQSDEFFSELK